jgi:ribosomal 50S subunit-associated protein YjgA (DUF615 family)
MGRSGRIDPVQLRVLHWRERLISEGFDAIAAFLEEYPDADPRELKRLVQKAGAMRHRHGTPRFLGRYIRALDDRKRATSGIVDDQARVPPTVS